MCVCASAVAAAMCVSMCTLQYANASGAGGGREWGVRRDNVLSVTPFPIIFEIN